MNFGGGEVGREVFRIEREKVFLRIYIEVVSMVGEVNRYLILLKGNKLIDGVFF